MVLQNSVLIIEDEWIEQELLAGQVAIYLNNNYDILLASNGMEALDLCQKHYPSILLVDINIPGLNGLSLIKTLREFEYPGKIIITTAYDLFDYAKKAIEMGVDSYLLKPIEQEELNASLASCIESLEKEEKQYLDNQSLQIGIESAFSYAESYLVNDLLSGNIPANALQNAFSWPKDGELQVRYLQLRSADEGCERFFIAKCREFFSKRNLMLTAKVGKDIIVFLQPKSITDIAFLDAENYFYCWMLWNEMPSHKVSFLYSSNVHHEFNELYRSFTNTQSQYINKEHLKNKLYVDIPDYSYLCAAKSRSRLRQRWLQRFSEKNTSYIISMLKRVISKKEAYWPGVLLFLEMLYQFDKYIDLQEVFDIFCGDLVYQKLDNWMNNYFSFESNYSSEHKNHHKAVAERIMDYLNEQYSNPDLSEKIVAEEFGFSQEHFSRIFKKELGSGFISVLTKLRMEQAKSLLLEPSISMQEISQKCGYLNRNYFFRVFKKNIGYTPSEFREKYAIKENSK